MFEQALEKPFHRRASSNIHAHNDTLATAYIQLMGRAKRKNEYAYSRVGGIQDLEHIHVVEAILGKKLPQGAQIHHVNENKRDNRPSNLVVCPNYAYHALLHRRTRAFDACGHADWLKCSYCQKWDDPQNLKLRLNHDCTHPTGFHYSCHIDYNRLWRQRRRLEA